MINTLQLNIVRVVIIVTLFLFLINESITILIFSYLFTTYILTTEG